ncbi:uncharacterized protein AMSG_04972 [Thecamonas trahens ATCC 50062]|uniref:Pre-rRNA-processing protein TSR2 n=1 Tax=Thecamonas trahens ATCC 50062 TaxID=461836 RepID=A0A0L0DB51_THETB|nr:hypothetical protein AMSG_04972 [Thecamonas trahens ATCC 50062]KNC48528.1 hypothetical protein AMSG_04972 [Thecamonas trahens ATCC 50062]|eukprot:XP_013758636.1 hypothetical protein AMSG_04972 [Thecamonas trahens ATCC 50062]
MADQTTTDVTAQAAALWTDFTHLVAAFVTKMPAMSYAITNSMTAEGGGSAEDVANGLADDLVDLFAARAGEPVFADEVEDIINAALESVAMLVEDDSSASVARLIVNVYAQVIAGNREELDKGLAWAKLTASDPSDAVVADGDDDAAPDGDAAALVGLEAEDDEPVLVAPADANAAADAAAAAAAAATDDDGWTTVSKKKRK